MRLIGARIARNACETERMDVSIRHGRIVGFGPGRARDLEVDLSGYLLLPGLINAHDHLEFNLFPRLGRGPYGNAVEWARDVYHPDCPPVAQHLALTKRIRLLWGGLKNLLSGVTTVAHHNPYDSVAFDRRSAQL
jgi:cytosine/adenosine deaminase-related metal-dependent hydrolase